MTIYAFIDGASRGNPGESGIGVILRDEKRNVLATHKSYIGQTTNNVAEYRALLACLTMVDSASGGQCHRLVVHSDSELMVRQLQGRYKVKDPELKKHFGQVQQLLRPAGGTSFEFEIVHVTREQNMDADELANVAINLKST